MTYFRLDVDFCEHPKIMGLTDGAFRLHVRAMGYAKRLLTDGRIPVAFPAKRVTIEELVAADLWEEVQGGWVIHDWLEWNESRDEVEVKRAAAKDRMARVRSRDVRANEDDSSPEVRSTRVLKNRVQRTENKKQEQDLSPALQDDRFKDFWDSYPSRNGKKLDKAKTAMAWSRLAQAQRSEALDAVAHYSAAVGEGLTLAKDPLRWLQGRCWADWQTPAQPTLPPSPNGHRGPATNGYDLGEIRGKLGGYLAAHVVAEIEGSLAESGPVTARRLAGAAKARGRSMHPPVHVPEIEEL